MEASIGSLSGTKGLKLLVPMGYHCSFFFSDSKFRPAVRQGQETGSGSSSSAYHFFFNKKWDAFNFFIRF
jgi:hypothetical protein